MNTTLMTKITQVDMSIIWEIEDEFGSLERCPDDDPRLRQLQRNINILSDDEVMVQMQDVNVDIIEDLRERSNMSIDALCYDMDIGVRSYYRLLSGIGDIKVETMTAVMDYYDKDLDYFKKKVTIV